MFLTHLFVLKNQQEGTVYNKITYRLGDRSAKSGNQQNQRSLAEEVNTLEVRNGRSVVLENTRERRVSFQLAVVSEAASMPKYCGWRGGEGF